MMPKSIIKEKKGGSQSENSTKTGSLAQIGSLTEAFSWEDFSNIKLEEVVNDPAAAKIMAILYAQTEKEKRDAVGKLYKLMAQVQYYQSLLTSSIAFAIISVLGTIVIGLGISLDMNWYLIVIGGALVLGGEIMPRVMKYQGDIM